MSLLSHTQLRALVEQKVICNVRPEQINASSIDITLGRYVLLESSWDVKMGHHPRYVSLRERTPLHTIKHDFLEDGPLMLLPGMFVLAQSIQVFNLPNHISAEYKLKSSMARVGLEHLNAGWCDAGWNGSVLTLELKNMTRWHTIGLNYGDAIGQMVFFTHEPVAPENSYATRGRYNGDAEVRGIKP